MKNTEDLIQNISEGKNLSFEESKKIFLSIMSGNIGEDLIITAETTDNIIMGIMHKKYNIHGVQFHPESIKTPEGMKLLKNFLKY